MMIRLTGLVALATVVATLTLTAGTAGALSTAACTKYIASYGDRPVGSFPGPLSAIATMCLLNRQRTIHRRKALIANTTLHGTAEDHVEASIRNKFWDVNRGLVSHLEPGTPVPSDAQQLQDAANAAIDGRIRGAGYCAGGRQYSDGEITYGGVGSGATPRAAVTWWMNDMDHRVALLKSSWKEFGAHAQRGSAFPGGDDATSATFVVDFGSCTK
jgi:uncharacterized protein YkwD